MQPRLSNMTLIVIASAPLGRRGLQPRFSNMTLIVITSGPGGCVGTWRSLLLAGCGLRSGDRKLQKSDGSGMSLLLVLAGSVIPKIFQLNDEPPQLHPQQQHIDLHEQTDVCFRRQVAGVNYREESVGAFTDLFRLCDVHFVGLRCALFDELPHPVLNFQCVIFRHDGAGALCGIYPDGIRLPIQDESDAVNHDIAQAVLTGDEFLKVGESLCFGGERADAGVILQVFQRQFVFGDEVPQVRAGCEERLHLRLERERQLARGCRHSGCCEVGSEIGADFPLSAVPGPRAICGRSSSRI